MKTTKRYTVQPGKIRSLQDLRLEQQRLRLEIMKAEVEIQHGYRDILQAFTLKNLAATVINDVSASSAILSKAFSFGKSIMEKRRKKKHDKVVAEHSHEE